MLGDDGLAEELEVGLFAEEVGFVGGQQVDHGLQFVGIGVAGDEAVVLGETGKPVVLQPLPQAAHQQHLLAVRQADPSDLVDQLLELRKLGVADVGVVVGCHGNLGFWVLAMPVRITHDPVKHG